MNDAEGIEFDDVEDGPLSIYVYGGPDLTIGESVSLHTGDEVAFDGLRLWSNSTWHWMRGHEDECAAIRANSTHPQHKPRIGMPESFEHRVNNAFKGIKPAIIEEGMILNVTKIISDTIRVPEGEYIVAIVDSNKCTLIPATEAGGQNRFEVFKPTLAGFFNPEIHRKIKELPDGNTIAEAKANSRDTGGDDSVG